MTGTQIIPRATIDEVELDEEGCELGMHSWVGEVGKLSSDTPCTRCGEPYGDPA